MFWVDIFPYTTLLGTTGRKDWDKKPVVSGNGSTTENGQKADRNVSSRFVNVCVHSHTLNTGAPSGDDRRDVDRSDISLQDTTVSDGSWCRTTRESSR